MKRCPECRRDYYDDSLLYCLDDGSALLEGPVGIHSTGAPSSIHETDTPRAEPATKILGAIGGHQAGNTNAIAVLPFANMSRDEDAEYFSDGLAEELLNVLSKINGLRVAGRTSSFSFKGKQTNFAEIGRTLNVSSVLEGSVRMSGKHVRIAVQLVNVADGYHLWSESYDRTMDDIFEIQDDIAHSVVEELRSKLVGARPDANMSKEIAAELADAAKGRTEDPEAHRLMLLGRHYASMVNREAMLQAIKYFRQALELAPDNAICWVELGNAESVSASFGWSEFSEGYEKAGEAARKALSIQPDLAAAHALTGRVQLNQNLDFRGADASIRRAIELEPDNLFVLGSAAFVLGRFVHRLEETLDICRRALLLDPLNMRILNAFALAAYFAGHLDEAEAASRRSIEIAPQGVAKRADLGLVLLDKGRVDEARTAAAAEPGEPWRLWSLAIIENAAGRENEARFALDDLIASHGVTAAFQIAEVYSSLGEPDKAFEWLERAVAGHDPGTSAIAVSPLLKPLHDDQRWPALLEKIGYPTGEGDRGTNV